MIRQCLTNPGPIRGEDARRWSPRPGYALAIGGSALALSALV